MQNIVGLFDDRREAEAAVRALIDAGFSQQDISVVAHGGEYGQALEHGSEAAEGAGFGATGGALVGGIVALLVAPAVLAIPGIGPVVIGGTLAATLGATALGAGIGAAAGALVGALVGAGIPEHDAQVYAEGVRRGGVFIMLPVANDDEADRASAILKRHNVVDIDDRGRDYRSSGWERFDEAAEPYRTDEGTIGSRYGSATAPDRGLSGYTDRDHHDRGPNA